MGSNQAFCRDDDACFFLGQPQISKQMAICLINDGCLTATADDGYLTGLYMLQALCKQQRKNTCYTHVFILKNAKRDEIQHHTAKQGDNHAKEQMLVFSFGERCCALPHNDTPSAPFLRLQYPRKWQDHRSNIFSLPETKKVNKQQSPIINNKTLNRLKPIRNSKQTLNQP